MSQIAQSEGEKTTSGASSTLICFSHFGANGDRGDRPAL